MSLMSNYQLLLLIVPFLMIVLAAGFLGVFPKKSGIGKFIDHIGEKELRVLMDKNGLKTVTTASFQRIRILTAGITVVAVFLITAKGKDTFTMIVVGVLLFYALYKFFYLLLKAADGQRIRKLNMILPYTIKSIAYMATIFPVSNAFEKSIEIVPKEFKGDIEQLVQDIDADPISFAPYQNFIDRYDGKLHQLDFYLKTLYRMSKSATSEETKLLANLNSTISAEMSQARKAKNDAVNSRVSGLGLIPVGLLAVMLIYLLMAVVEAL